MNTQHHEFGMSRWPALLDCQCFESAGENKNTEMGTNWHWWFAHYLDMFCAEGKGEMPEELYSRGAYIAARQVVEEVKAFGGDPDKIKIEQRVTISTGGMLNGVFGTADAYYYEPENKRLYVWDFKTFYNPARDYTAQLMGYAYAIASSEKAGWEREDTVHIGVCYGDTPSKNHTDTVTLAEMCDVYQAVCGAYAAIRDWKAEPTQCGWCELCKHKAVCPAFGAVAKRVTSNPDLAFVREQWADLTIERKAQLGVIAETVSKWVDGVREAMKADLLNGGKIEDEANGIRYILRSSSGRKTPRPLDAWQMLVNNGVETSAIKGKLSISASAVKDLLKTVGVKGKAADALVADVSDIGSGSVSMVRG